MRVPLNEAVEQLALALAVRRSGPGVALRVSAAHRAAPRDGRPSAPGGEQVGQQFGVNLAELRTIQRHFAGLDRDPTDCELETLAQTWSETLLHKTLKGKIEFQGRTIDNPSSILFAATKELGLDWLVSVFSDNAGVVRFDDEHDVCFKVETHNHPSAIDPYGGSNTGIGGVIRDALGTGLGSKPICNTDVFCVAPADLPADRLPAGVLHPKGVLKGVVAGVRDYGNRMGIPTVNGVVVDRATCSTPALRGTAGVLPRQSFQES